MEDRNNRDDLNRSRRGASNFGTTLQGISGSSPPFFGQLMSCIGGDPALLTTSGAFMSVIGRRKGQEIDRLPMYSYSQHGQPGQTAI
jgi:hypothetical protein